MAALLAGLPVTVPGATVNRLCGSGLQAIVSASQSILLGDTDTALAGGAESMSRGGYMVPSARWGARMGEAKMLDMMVGALTDPFDAVHMGITAENVAQQWNVSREAQDLFAAESHRRALRAIEGRRDGGPRALRVQAREARRVAAKKRTVLAEQVMAAAEDACARIVRGQPAGARPARAVG